MSRPKIVQIVSRHIALERRGSGYVGLCPAHDDKSPSLAVSTKYGGIFKCFSCGFGGNLANAEKLLSEVCSKPEGKGHASGGKSEGKNPF